MKDNKINTECREKNEWAKVIVNKAISADIPVNIEKRQAETKAKLKDYLEKKRRENESNKTKNNR